MALKIVLTGVLLGVCVGVLSASARAATAPSVGSGNWGESIADDDAMDAGHQQPAKARLRSYVGARDEQTLEVQASLAQPSRTADGVSVAAPDDDDAPPVTAPASD